MRSDVVFVMNDGEGFNEALVQAEKVAQYKELPEKDALHLRLLTEEMMGIMHALTGERQAKFWIETEDNTYSLHLSSQAAMNAEMRKNLLAVSNTGENAAAKGVTGKLRDLFQRLLEPENNRNESSLQTAGAHGYSGADFGSLSAAASGIWSLGKYKTAVQEGNFPEENWDELEKSVVSRLADDVTIGISGQDVEMTIIKKF